MQKEEIIYTLYDALNSANCSTERETVVVKIKKALELLGAKVIWMPGQKELADK